MDDRSPPGTALASNEQPRQIGERYHVLERLGRGGMGLVYRVRDVATGRELALKQLRSRAHEAAALFEREFRTLAQLSHPHVIEVYDYGFDGPDPYYTMELLNGGDLREHAPMPWRRACMLVFEVGSSLALLHSRRLVHRDISPGNVRCTSDGHAKLIDFGAMVPMGCSGLVVGTPAYVAPEVVQQLPLDPRTDLFSLGATLYFALTGRPAFGARDFGQLRDAWAMPVLAPSRIVPDVPLELDALILSMVSIEPGLRPRSAFEVMQRLAAVADLPAVEAASVPQGYLSTPTVVGRDQLLRTFRGAMRHALQGEGGALWIEAPAGMGRSRVLDMCALEGQTMGATLVRTGAVADAGATFAGAQAMAEQLIAALPGRALEHAAHTPLLFAVEPHGVARLRPLTDSEADPSLLQGALASWVLQLAADQPLLIVVDDVQRLDEASTALLAALAYRAPRARLLLVVSAELRASSESRSALRVLAEQCPRKPSLRALTRAETESLLASIFGDVRNVALVSERVFKNAGGSPRQTLALAQHLVDRGAIVYSGGNWTLPEQLSEAELPASADEVFAARLTRLGALSRALAEAHALSLTSALTRDDHHRLAPEADPRRIDDALTELVCHEILTRDGPVYRLANRALLSALDAQLDVTTRHRRHRELAALSQHRRAVDVAVAFHLLAAGEDEQALDLLNGLKNSAWLYKLQNLDPATAVNTLERALDSSRAHGRPAREQFDLRRWIASASVISEGAAYARVGAVWRAQLELDSGLVAYRALVHVVEPAERLRLALEHAAARYEATSEHERVYRPDEAVALLPLFTVVSIVIGARALDLRLLSSLPELLAPFVALSPLIEAIWQNALAACEAIYRAQPERACARWLRVFELMSLEEHPDARHESIRYSVAYALGEVSASLGLGSALRWIEILDRLPAHRVNAMYLRRIVCLQQGDWPAAERCRLQAELMAIEASARQMFEPPLRTELIAHGSARDLAGVKQIADRMEHIAATRPGWRAHERFARGYLEALRGDSAAALDAFEQCIALSAPDPNDSARCLDAWLRATAGKLAVLVALGREQEARSCGELALQACDELEIDATANGVRCELALAEAAAGVFGPAAQRLERLLLGQLAGGVTGLQLGTTYEARARVAILAKQVAEARHYGALAAREYRHGAGSPLAARYGRLVQDARRAGIDIPAQLSSFESAVLMPGNEVLEERARWMNTVSDALDRVPAEERASCGLRLLCDAAQASGGHLFVARNGELRLAASLDGAPPPAALERFARGYWLQKLEDAEMSAVLTEHPEAEDGRSSALWVDGSGVAHQPVMLSRSEHAPVGLALLNLGNRRDGANIAGGLSAALGEKLAASVAAGV